MTTVVFAYGNHLGKYDIMILGNFGTALTCEEWYALVFVKP